MDDPSPYRPKKAKAMAHRSSTLGVNSSTTTAPDEFHLRIGMDFTNKTSEQISVTTRTGEVYILPTSPSFRRQDERVEFVTRRQVSRTVAVDKGHGRSDQEGRVADMIGNAFEEKRRTQSPYNRGEDSVQVLSHLTLRELKGMGGRVYLEDLDVVIAIHDPRRVVFHPYSVRAIEDYMALRWSDESSFMFRMYIVDNDGAGIVRYLNFNKHIHRIPSIQQEGTPDGVYITHPVSVTSGHCGEPAYETEYMSLAEAEKRYNLYRTFSDAETFGFDKDALAKEVLDTKRLDDRAKLSTNDIARAHELEKIRLAQSAAERKHEQDMERIRVEDERESILFKRKVEELEAKADEARKERDYAERERRENIEQLRAKHLKEMISLAVGAATAIIGLTTALVKVTSTVQGKK